MKKGIAVIAVFTALVSTAVCAQTAEQPSPEEAKRADIRKMMEVTGAGDLGTQVMTQMISIFQQGNTGIPNEFWTEFMAEVDVDELVEMCIPSYEKYFTHEEIKELLAFYETPLGKKMISVQPQIMQECMVIGQQWGQALGIKAAEKIQNYQAE